MIVLFVNKSAKLTFCTDKPELGAMPLHFTDATTHSIVAEATVPPAIANALVLLIPIDPAPASGLRYQTYVLDDTIARQFSFKLLIINI